MSFENIPEDREESFQCEKCMEGNIHESKEFPGLWECDSCEWESSDKD